MELEGKNDEKVGKDKIKDLIEKFSNSKYKSNYSKLMPNKLSVLN
jgi:hypothetical protein